MDIQTYCKICGNPASSLFETNVLHKYPVKYYQCSNCSFIQTEEPFWLEEAYTSPIGLLDVGLLHRNFELAQIIPAILDQLSIRNNKYLDYGGGYGIFVRLMRDKGYDFYLADKYSKNLFAQFFELKDAGIDAGFSCLTTFEVFEHLVSPIDEINKMFLLTDTILFSTELQPDIRFKSVDDWWYFVPEGGQHIALYSLRTLKQLKEHFKCYLYTNRFNLHILSKYPLPKDPFAPEVKKALSFRERLYNKLFKPQPIFKSTSRNSLLQKDFSFYKTKLLNGNK
jgi:hypothetical protein